ncbi:hypothetical protein [Dongia sp.]|uniref:hypothetical protein n=1 Tax=Dongia sp. TaxID=1977262 RepID=UPI003750235C
MDRNREEELRRRATKVRDGAGKPEGQDRAHRAQAARDVDAARNPVGNGQGDAQADDPNNEMNAPSGKGDRRS